MATGSQIIENCKKYLGKPYVWGGESMSEGGYDCSGFAYNVLRDSGYKVARTTAQGFSSLGTAIAYSNAIAGDLLFFGKSKSSINHIAIYAGDGKMYESIGGSSNTKSNPGKGVTLSNVSRRSDLILVKRIAEVTSSSSSTTSSTTRTYLMKGDKGDAVKELQNNLNTLGYSCGSADGIFGDATDKAVRAFQSAYGLTVDGKYGNSSKAKMVEALNAKKSASSTTSSSSTNSNSAFTTFVKSVQSAIGAKVDGVPGSETLSKTITVSKSKNNKHAVVKPLQIYLNALGYDCGNADGIAGSKFDAAVKAYQNANGCVADGEITAGKGTWKKLLKLA